MEKIVSELERHSLGGEEKRRLEIDEMKLFLLLMMMMGWKRSSWEGKSADFNTLRRPMMLGGDGGRPRRVLGCSPSSCCLVPVVRRTPLPTMVPTLNILTQTRHLDLHVRPYPPSLHRYSPE